MLNRANKDASLGNITWHGVNATTVTAQYYTYIAKYKKNKTKQKKLLLSGVSSPDLWFHKKKFS